jgi:hypothetical protein
LKHFKKPTEESFFSIFVVVHVAPFPSGGSFPPQGKGAPSALFPKNLSAPTTSAYIKRVTVRSAVAEGSSWTLGEYAVSIRPGLRSTASLPPHIRVLCKRSAI